MKTPSPKLKRAAVVLYANYSTDARPRREAEALAQAGVEVDVISLQEVESGPRQEKLDGVNVFHARLRQRRGSKLTYMAQYGAFFLQSFWFLSRRTLRARYDLVHVHNMPDFLV